MPAESLCAEFILSTTGSCWKVLIDAVTRSDGRTFSGQSTTGTQSASESEVPLPQPPEYWDCRHAPWHLTWFTFLNCYSLCNLIWRCEFSAACSDHHACWLPPRLPVTMDCYVGRYTLIFKNHILFLLVPVNMLISFKEKDKKDLPSLCSQVTVLGYIPLGLSASEYCTGKKQTFL